jgi:hypothetical protein
VSGEGNDSTSKQVPGVASPLAVIGATQAVATEKVTKVTNILETVNPLHLGVIPKVSPTDQVRRPSVASCCDLPLTRALNSVCPTAGFCKEYASAEVTGIEIGWPRGYRYLRSNGTCDTHNVQWGTGRPSRRGELLHFWIDWTFTVHAGVWQIFRRMHCF